MVYLSRIYTKTGDRGDTGLGDGSRVPKDDIRVSTCGEVDELNAVLGLLLVDAAMRDGSAETVGLLRGIQNDLFDLGADLCRPQGAGEKPGEHLRVTAAQVAKLEGAIDRLNADLRPLRSFILPGGGSAAAWCHLARTICRRAERAVVTLARAQTINPQLMIYLNRLSDLLFVLARVCNSNGQQDVLWLPGGGYGVVSGGSECGA
jgi:cob(I)alamin adenosyltransferase